MKYFNCTKSWYEQRQFLDLTVTSLGDNPVVKKIKEEFAKLEPHKTATIPSELSDIESQFKVFLPDIKVIFFSL